MVGSWKEAAAAAAPSPSLPSEVKRQRRCVQSKLPWGLGKSRCAEEESDSEGKGKGKRKQKPNSLPRATKKSPNICKQGSQLESIKCLPMKGQEEEGDALDIIDCEALESKDSKPTKDIGDPEQYTQQPGCNFRMDGKLTSEEGFQLSTGKQIHPFFACFKETRRQAVAAAIPESENSQKQYPDKDALLCTPVHVFDKLEDNFVELQWRSWVFTDEALQPDSYCSLEVVPSIFEGVVKPLKLDTVHHWLDLDHYVDTANSTGVTEDTSLRSRWGNWVVSFDEQDNSLAKGSLQSYNLRSTHFSQNSLWTNKYQPENASEVCGNTKSVSFLSEWLQAWHEVAQKSNESSSGNYRESAGAQDSLSVESDEDDTYGADHNNVLLITGPVGSGKSAAIYACAKEQGFEVIEVNASDSRNRTFLKQQFSGGLESHALNRCLFGDAESKVKDVFSTAADIIDVDDIHDASLIGSSETCQQNEATTKRACNIIKEKTADCQFVKRSLKKSLVLFEDVDTIFNEDHGFISAVLQLAEKAKRPIILTSNNKKPILPQLLDRLVVDFTIPSSEDLLSHVYMVCAAERVDIPSNLLERLINYCTGDIRRTLLLLQFWCQGSKCQIDNSMCCPYSPLPFDIDAAHLILPRVIPWDLHCDLSEKIEEEISRTISAIEAKVWLEAISEQVFNPSGMVDSNGQSNMITRKKKGKKAMLKQNCSFLEPSACADPLDFSDASDSPVAFAQRRVRHRPYTVLSSQSDDGLSISEFPSRESLSTNHNANLFLKKAILPVLQTKEALNQVEPPSSIACPPERFGTHELPYASQICESSRLQDVSCVPKSSFVSGIDSNKENADVDMPFAFCQKSVNSADFTRIVPEESGVDVTFVNSNMSESNKFSQDYEEDSCEIDLELFFMNEDLNSSPGNLESQTNGFQLMDECSRADFGMKLAPAESCCCSYEVYSVKEKWIKLRNCCEDLKSYLNPNRKHAYSMVDLSSRLTDLLSETDVMISGCKPLLSDSFEPCIAPSIEPDDFCWSAQQFEMGTTFAQHGFCLYTSKFATMGSTLGSQDAIDLTQEMLASSTDIMALGKLLINQNACVGAALAVPPCRFAGRELESDLHNVILSTIPARFSLSLRGTAFHEYASFMSQISKSENSRISERTNGIQRRRSRAPVHYLSAGQFSLTPEDVNLLAQSFCFKEQVS